jgi:hypothetical protein
MTDELTEKEMTPEQATAIVTGYNELGKKIAEAGIPAAAKPAEEDKPTEETQTDEKPAMESEDDDATTEQKMVMRPTQAEVSYVTLSTKKGAACANCRWFSANGHMGNEGAYCHLIDNWPDDILPTGYCERHEAKPDMTMPEQPPIPVVIVEAEEKAVKEHVSIAQRIKDTLKTIRAPKDDPNFTVFKAANGKTYWKARFTNNFEDRSSEIISEKALENYVRRVEIGLVPMPELRSWHVPGSRHGVAEMVFGHGNFVTAIGPFDDTLSGQHAIKSYQARKGNIGLSQGFTHPKWAKKDGVYEVMNTFEISTLPPGAAANPFTSFEEIEAMKIGEKQRQWLEETVGKEKAAEIITQDEKDSDAIKSLGAQYKDFGTVIPEQKETPKPEEDTVAKAFVDVIEAQSELLRIAKAQAAEIVALKAARTSDVEALKTATDTITALKADADAFRAFMNLTPRRASSDDKTALTPEQAAEVKKDIPTDVDPFWASLGVPKEA